MRGKCACSATPRCIQGVTPVVCFSGAVLTVTGYVRGVIRAYITCRCVRCGWGCVFPVFIMSCFHGCYRISYCLEVCLPTYSGHRLAFDQTGSMYESQVDWEAVLRDSFHPITGDGEECIRKFLSSGGLRTRVLFVRDPVWGASALGYFLVFI